MRWKRTSVLTLAFGALLAAPVAAATGASSYRDVPASSTHAGSIAWLAEHGITQGCAAEHFCADDTVSRAHAATFLKRLAEARVVDAGTVEGFTAEQLRGRTGTAGADGAPGASGAAGRDGVDGTQGPAGADGQHGAVGPAGAPGKDGATWLTGTGAPADDLGRSGDLYLDTASSTWFGPRTEQGWGQGTSLVGPAGSADASTLSTSFVAGNSVSVPAGTWSGSTRLTWPSPVTATVRCPFGSRATGGSYGLMGSSGSFRDIAVHGEWPTDDGLGWQVEAMNHGSNTGLGIQPRVMCARVVTGS